MIRIVRLHVSDDFADRDLALLFRMVGALFQVSFLQPPHQTDIGGAGIAGTDAAATVAPDLTHLASRGTIASGTLSNTPANLASWILAPQRLKPGAQMPATTLPPDDLAALVTYLASLR